MKLITSLRWMIVPMIVLLFASCDNEPIDQTGFPDIEQEIVLESGDFIATINDSNMFNAGVSSAVLDTDGFLVISGANQGSGEILTLSVENAEVGAFSLNANNNTLNSAVYIVLEQAANPYTTATEIGGSGSMMITELDMTAQVVSGTFGFLSNRIRQDASGNPVNDSAGNPIIETVTATNGEYFQIPFTIEDTGSGGTDDDPDGENPDGEMNISNSFEAFINLEGDENDGLLIGDTIITELATVGGIPVIRIVALNDDGESIRIDIPEDFELGTYDMVNLSNGSELIALYNDGQGTANLTSNPGTLTITDFSRATGRIVGTFAFTGTDPLLNKSDIVEITNGAFRIYYEPNPDNTPEPFSVNVDEVLVTTTEIENGVFLFAGSDVEVFTFTGLDELQSVTVTIPRDITTGSYTMVPEQIDGSEVIGFYTPDTTIVVPQVFTSITGTLNVNSYDTITGNIEGTFNFSATDPTGQDSTVYEITEGTFFFTIED